MIISSRNNGCASQIGAILCSGAAMVCRRDGLSPSCPVYVTGERIFHLGIRLVCFSDYRPCSPGPDVPRQSFSPVHLLGFAPFLSRVGPVAGDVKLQDDGVVHDPVNRRGGGHRVGKDAFPLRENQV